MKGHRITLVFVALISVALLTIITTFPEISTASSSSLAISQSTNKSLLQSGQGGTDVVYTINASNNDSCAPKPLDIVLVFDRSDSMKFDNANPPQPLQDAKNSAVSFVNSVNYSKDRIGLVSYSGNATLNVGLSASAGPTVSAINGLNTSAGTNVYEAINTARTHLQNSARGEAQKVIVVFSDGRANRPNPNTAASMAISEASVAKQQGIRIISISLGSGADQSTMSQIASSSSDYYYSPSAQGMAAIYSKIYQELQGDSPTTNVSTDIASMLGSMQFVSASNGGRLIGGKVVWNLGSLGCGESVKLQYTMRTNVCVVDKATYSTTAIMSNSNGKSAASNSTKIDVVGPNLTIELDDSKSVAGVGDTIIHKITVRNLGSGNANNVEVGLQLAEFLTSTDQTSWSFDLAAGATREIEVTSIVNDKTPPGYTDTKSTASLTNACGNKQAGDTTTLFKAAPPLPDFELSACTELADGKYIVYFGYNNKLKITQRLDTSVLLPSGTLTAPTSLKPGSQPRVFGAPLEQGSVEWSASVGDYISKVTATSSTPLCGDPEPKKTVPSYGGTPTSFVGVTRSNADPTPGNNVSPTVGGLSTDKPFDCTQEQKLRINFTAIDDDGIIVAAQYSLNGGIGWFPINDVQGLGTNSITGSFTTRVLRDGNYEVKIRVLDNNNNIGESTSEKRNISCRGIVIESTQFNQLTQLSPLSTRGVVHSFANVKQYMAIVVAGGPEKVIVYARQQESEEELEFELNYNQRLEVWEGELLLPQPGFYELEVEASTSEGALTKRSTNSIQAVEYGKILDSSGGAVAGSNVTLYYRESDSAPWQKWNGNAFAQDNPMLEVDGYTFFVEPGWYYIDVEHPHYFTTTTRQFYVSEYSLLATDITLYPKGEFWNWWRSQVQKIEAVRIEDSLTRDLRNMLGKELPQISLTDGARSWNTEDIVNEGKPTLIITWTDWGTIPAAQLHQFDRLFGQDQEIYDPEKFTILPTGLLEGKEENKVVVNRGRYAYPVLKPIAQDFYDKMFVISAPQYYFLDNNGIVRDIRVGNYFAEELIDILKQVEEKQI